MEDNLMPPKRILLTGAGGFAGSHMLRAILKNTEMDVVCLATFRHKGLQDRIKVVLEENPNYLKRIKVVIQDLASPISSITAIEIGNIDYVVNFASESHVDRSIKYPVQFISNNIAIVLNLLEWARGKKIQRFIQISTDEVYGDHDSDDPSTEWEGILKPSNPYSASKAAQESICLAYARTYDIPMTITNTVNMFGETQDPEKFIPRIISQILRDEPVKIHALSQNQIGSRVYLHASNNADAILFLVDHLDSNEVSKIHISSQDIISNLEMAEMVAEEIGKKLIAEFDFEVINRPGHDFHYALDGSKLNTLGWIQPESLSNGIHNVVNWYLKNEKWLDPRNFKAEI
jgi:dTDP-glucose 4,6-dehydratase